MMDERHRGFRATIAVYAEAWDIQRHSIGALMMRELHTRYGRENIGYLWMILEPMLLASMVAVLHVSFGDGGHLGSDMQVVPFAVLGYSYFIMFRQMFLRAEGALEANTPLLYHRSVTIFDIMLSRGLLEGAGTTATFLILIFFACMMGLSHPPARPLFLIISIVMMMWFSWGLSMIVCAITNENRLIGKFIHPFSYILMPISGAFFQVKWIPEPARTWVSWSPMTQIFEMARYGQFESARLTYVNFPYIIGWCMIFSYIGLVAIKMIRRHVRLY